MTLKLGTLAADITADTSGLKTAEREVKTTTEKINRELITTEVEAGKVEVALIDLGQEAKRTAEKFKFTVRETRAVSGEYVRMNSAIKGTAKASTATEKATKKVSKGFKLAGRSAGQAGIQIQQFVGQIQGGQNAFVALSQQSADLGFVLGAPLVGVVVSLAAVIGGVLFNALGASSEAMERASTSASDLSSEYLKLTKQAEQLEAVKISAAMLEDAAAIELLNEELGKLEKKRSGLTRIREDLAPELLKDVDADIREVDNKLQAFFILQEERSKRLNEIFNKSFSLGEDPGAETDAPTGPENSTFDQLMQKEIAALQLRGQLFNDSNATIEAEILRFQLASLNLFEEGSADFIEAEQALADKRIELRALADKKIADQTTRSTKLQENQLKAARMGALNGMVQLGDQLNNALAASGKEGTAIAKAVFLAQKAIQVVSILAATEVAAANAAAVAALGGPVPFFATQGAIRATGFASAGIVAGLAIGGGRQFGGPTSPNLAHPINEAGIPEILNQGGKQFLLPTGEGGNITPLRGGQGGGMPNITIINEPGVTTEIESVTMGDVVLVARRESKAAADKINTSLSNGRGEAANAIRNGFDVSRNIK